MDHGASKGGGLIAAGYWLTTLVRRGCHRRELHRPSSAITLLRWASRGLAVIMLG